MADVNNGPSVASMAMAPELDARFFLPRAQAAGQKSLGRSINCSQTPGRGTLRYLGADSRALAQRTRHSLGRVRIWCGPRRDAVYNEGTYDRRGRKRGPQKAATSAIRPSGRRSVWTFWCETGWVFQCAVTARKLARGKSALPPRAPIPELPGQPF